MPHPIPADLPPDTIATLQAIERQFTITDQKLLDITRQFLDDFNLGLSQYNKPMAMMFKYTDKIFITIYKIIYKKNILRKSIIITNFLTIKFL